MLKKKLIERKLMNFFFNQSIQSMSIDGLTIELGISPKNSTYRSWTVFNYSATQ